MTNKYRIENENEEIKVDEIILEAEDAGQKEKTNSVQKSVFGESIKKAEDKISLILVFALLVLSIIQSFELFNLRAQIAKGEFSAGAPVSAQDASQGLPSQQGGC